MDSNTTITKIEYYSEMNENYCFVSEWQYREPYYYQVKVTHGLEFEVINTTHRPLTDYERN